MALFKFINKRLYSCLSEIMRKTRIVPDVIDIAPEEEICVIYPNGIRAQLGGELKPTAVKDQPTVTYEAKDRRKYLMCLIDPDSPCRDEPKDGEWLHWLVVNINNSHVEHGNVLASYIGSLPAEDTGLHRYIFLVYEQPLCCNLDFGGDLYKWTAMSVKNRTNFSMRSFAKKYELGDPAFGNFYQARYDDYVHQLWSKLKC